MRAAAGFAVFAAAVARLLRASGALAAPKFKLRYPNSPPPAPTARGGLSAEDVRRLVRGVQHVGYGGEGFQFVDTEEGVRAVALALRGVKLVGVDVEHTKRRSFRGYVCLIQVASATHTWLLDCMVPAVRSAVPEYLGPVLGDPSVLTVLHGCGNDALWLHSNFAGLTLRGVLDTNQAAVALGLPSRSYAALCQSQLGVLIDKAHQTSDWRLRPLPASMLMYASDDAKHLLPLAHALVACVDDATLGTVLERSTAVATVKPSKLVSASTYVQPDLRVLASTTRAAAGPLKSVAPPPGRGFSSPVRRDRVAALLGRLHQWRFDVATSTDEDLNFVAPMPVLYAAVHAAVSGDHAAVIMEAADALAGGRVPSAAFLRRLCDPEPPTPVMVAHAAALVSFVYHGLTCPLASIRGKLDTAAAVPKENPDDATKCTGPSLSRALYNNTSLEAPSGMVLAKVDKKRANWYLKRNLGVARYDGAGNLEAVRMLQEPNGVGMSDDSFHLKPKLNQCVICGTANDLRRFFIVPSAYRSLFPPAAKQHTSHDIVLCCAVHHRQAATATDKLSVVIHEEMGVSNMAFTVPPEVAAAREAKVAASRYRKLQKVKTVPPERLAEVSAMAKAALGVDVLTDEALDAALAWKAPPPPVNATPYGAVVRMLLGGESGEVAGAGAGVDVDAVRKDGRLNAVGPEAKARVEAFVRRFRVAFLAAHAPTHMPQGWSVEYSVFHDSKSRSRGLLD